MSERQKHRQEVRGFLQKNLSKQDWIFSLPNGSGMETYQVKGGQQEYFIKIGVPLERYRVMAELGLTPPIVTFGQLESGPSIIVQPLLEGRNPSRKDYREQLERIATLIQAMHGESRLREVVQPAPTNLYRDAGRQALHSLRQRWERHREQVPSVAEFVDKSLQELDSQISEISGAGLVASHNDICNANWLLTSDGRIYVVDFESMSMDDPANDMGALLWWYYPPELRERFLEIAGYRYDHDFKSRMRIRLALHCLSITLPRENSFDRFRPEHYAAALQDFRAVLAGEENPQGYF